MNANNDFDAKYNIIDRYTPHHTLLSGRYKKSFAYHTLRNRLPVTLTSIIDNLTKSKEEMVVKYGEECREELKKVIGQLSQLKYQLQTDKALLCFEGDEPDKELWNDFITELTASNGTFFKACWLYSECYMYRRVSSIFEATTTLKEHDYFAAQKNNGLLISIDAMDAIARSLRAMECNIDNLKLIIKLNLWGNRCDLSITSGQEVKVHGNPFDRVNDFDENIIVNHEHAIRYCLAQIDKAKPVIIDFVVDNAGYELFTDFIFAEFLVTCYPVKKVRFHVKAIPWFISDVTAKDFHWTLDYLKKSPQQALSDLGRKWSEYMDEGKFELQPPEYFWTGPHEFYRMRDINLPLYKKLAEAYLVFFKGDLNYRKLIGDFSWDHTESFVTCLRGFQPTNICSLRTVKADLICGLEIGVSEQLSRKDKDWMTTGEYGTIQYADGVYCGCDNQEAADAQSND